MNEYEIPEGRFSKFDKEFGKLVKLAKKANLPEPTYQITKEFVKEFKVGENAFLEPIIYKVPIKVVEIDCGVIKLPGGWELVGIIDHTDDINLMREIPDKKIPKKYWDADDDCDYCKKNIRRNETFVIHSKGYKKVGRQCLQKFLGIDGNAIARYFERIKLGFGSEVEEDWLLGSGHHYISADLDQVIGSTLVAIREYGWKSRSQAYEEYSTSTADRVGHYLFYTPYEGESLKPSKDDLEKANQIIEWTRKLKPKTTYEENLRSIAEAEYSTLKSMGFACSMVICYNKAMKLFEKKKKFNGSVSKWVGEVKIRSEYEVEVYDVLGGFQTEWGMKYGIKFLTPEKDLLIWWTTSADLTEYEIGAKGTIKTTVKKHSEYQNVKQTEIIRVKWENK